MGLSISLASEILSNFIADTQNGLLYIVILKALLQPVMSTRFVVIRGIISRESNGGVILSQIYSGGTTSREGLYHGH